MHLGAVLFVPLLAWSGAATDGSPEVLDRVAAVVDGQVVTLSELDFEARVNLIQRGGLTAASGPLDEDALRSALELSIAQRVQAQEADKLQAFVPEPAEVSAALTQFERRFPSPGAFQAFLAEQEAEPGQLAAVIARGLRAERLLDSKVQLRAQVPDWEVRRYYDIHPELQTTPFEELRGPLKEKLARERYAELARQELGQMVRAAHIRRVAPFARTRPAEDSPR